MLLRKIGEFFQEPEDKCMQKLSEQKPKERPQLGNCYASKPNTKKEMVKQRNAN